MKNRYDIRKWTALVTALVMALCLLPAGVVSGEGEGSELCSDFTIPSGVITDYTIQASEGASIDFDPASGPANAIIIHSGTVQLSNEGISKERIIVDGNATLVLAGVNVQPDDGPGVKIAPTASANVELAAGTTNTLTGGSGYAGLEVGWESSSRFAEVTIRGKGTLNATGNGGSAGIGGSNRNRNSAGKTISTYHGTIIIESGTITATGNGGGAGIGTGNNNRTNEDGSSSTSASYKMTKSKTNEDVPTWGNITIKDGRITARGNGGSAGIGGGNHVDSSLITISGGTINATSDGGGGAGIGCGIGSQKQESNLTKGPGYYNAKIKIAGGTITAKAGWLGAGIGGGYSCDAWISIEGGSINATGGNGNSGANYQGGPGIGAGYMGIPQLTISGSKTTITAKGGTGAPGIGYGPGALEGNTAKERGQDATYKYTQSYIRISGGTINAQGGINGAGIGGGNGNQHCHITITGGDITARGYSDPSNLKVGGAGIGSGTGKQGGATKYQSDTELDISISGDAKVLAIGGWGASGIGSGAKNKMANTVSIFGNTQVEAYADGTKFAIDTRVLGSDGMTTSKERDVSLPILQGTFVHNYTTPDGIPENPEGLNSIQVINDQTGAQKTLTRMPAGYRSFAANVSSAGSYTVYTDAESIGEGEGRYFARTAKDVFNEDEILETGIKYTVSGSSLSDNFYLFPVKTVVVEKKIAAEGGIDLSGLNETFWFGLYNKATGAQEGALQPIRIVKGVPQGKAYFTNVPDGSYDVLEVTAGGKKMSPGTVFGMYELKKIQTEDSEGGTTNNGTIDEEQWTDKVTVKNTFSEITTRVTGTKTWDDGNDADKIRPASVTVQLYADGAAVEGMKATVSADTNWAFAFEGVPKNHANGTRIKYTVKEEPVPNGYEATYSTPAVTDSGTVVNITNTHKPEEKLISVTVRKIWDDNNDARGLRPAQIVMTLSNGMTVTLNEANGWSATIDNLPAAGEDGKPITYKWTERDVIGYTRTNVTTTGNTTTFTNSLWKRPETTEKGKIPKTPGEEMTVFEDYDTPLGVAVSINHAGDCFE